ncbi:MAG: T9SS type A sorting domain-containing protein [Calditrichaeota bacterium]|nr:T9SS type A sorting domain-containing protein [Calditrichota bacterium]
MSGKILFFNLMLFLACLPVFADSTTVKIFEQNFIHFGGGVMNDTEDFTEEDNGRIVSRTIDLPEFVNPVKITAHLIVNSNGDPWDRAGSIFLSVPGTENIELLKFITGFGGYSDLTQDVSYLAPLLKGKRTIKAFVDTWVNSGWVVDFELIYQETDTIQPPSWNQGLLYSWGLTRKAAESDTPDIDINVPLGRERLMLTYYASGHALKGSGGDEFVTKDNVIAVDGKEVYRYRPWRDDCRNFRDRNPQSGRWGNTWSSDFSRSGWCPGDKVYPVILDVTEPLTSGVHNIAFWVENIRPSESDGNAGYWRISSFLTGWGNIDNWKPVKIEVSGPEGGVYQTNRNIAFRIDLTDNSGLPVVITDQTLEISCERKGAEFSQDKRSWSNPLSVRIKNGSLQLWFRSGENGEFVIRVKDPAGVLPEADPITVTVNNFEPGEGEENFALKYKAVSADCACNDNEKPEFALDGSLTTKWCCNNGGSDWMTVTLPDSVELNYFIIRHAGAGRAPEGDPGHGDNPGMNTRDFAVQIRDSAGDWKNVVSVVGNPQNEEGNVTYHALPQAVKTDQVRLLITDQGSDNAARIYEFEMYNRDLSAIDFDHFETARPPELFFVYPNYPNPFNAETTIKIFVPEFSGIQATVFDSRGRLVRHLLSGKFPRGFHTFKWNGLNIRNQMVASGVYFLNVRFTKNDGTQFVKLRKLILAK